MWPTMQDIPTTLLHLLDSVGWGQNLFFKQIYSYYQVYIDTELQTWYPRVKLLHTQTLKAA